MRTADGDQGHDQVTGLLHRDTQEFEFGVDLTVAEVHRLTGRGSLDFGGSEFSAARAERLEPIQRQPDDEYGWWPLQAGTYRIVYNEGVRLDEDEVGLVQPHPRLMEAGGHHPSFAVFGEQDTIGTILSVGSEGLDIKENSRISRLLILGS